MSDGLYGIEVNKTSGLLEWFPNAIGKLNFSDNFSIALKLTYSISERNVVWINFIFFVFFILILTNLIAFSISL